MAYLRPEDELVLDFIYPPIPIRQFDWQATWDNDEPDDNGNMLCGHGRTPLDAIVDLLDSTEQDEDYREWKRAQTLQKAKASSP